MIIAAAGLILLSSLLHAGWNLLLKQSQDKTAFTAGLLWAGTVLFLPVAVWDLLRSGGLPQGAWVLLLLSCGLEGGYWVLLSRAYARGDMSQVYPLARGTGAFMAALLGTAFLGERLGLGAVAGMAAVLVGVYMVNLPALSRDAALAPWRAAGTPVFWLAVATGVCTGLYSFVDKLAVSNYNLPVLAYLWVSYAGSAVAYMLMNGRRRVARGERWRVLAAGLFSPLTYMLVLLAMTLAPVSRVAVVREITLVWGTLLGVLVLKEPAGRPRIVGALVIVAGVVALALLR